MLAQVASIPAPERLAPSKVVLINPYELGGSRLPWRSLPLAEARGLCVDLPRSFAAEARPRILEDAGGGFFMWACITATRIAIEAIPRIRGHRAGRRAFVRVWPGMDV